jgi:hypothetical protein
MNIPGNYQMEGVNIKVSVVLADLGIKVALTLDIVDHQKISVTLFSLRYSICSLIPHLSSSHIGLSNCTRG